MEKLDDTKAASKATPIIEEINDERGERASSEEHAVSPVRKSRSTRTTPKKRNSTSSNQRDKSVEKKVETIPEEIENGAEASGDKSVDIDSKLSTEKESVKKTNDPFPVELQKEPEETEEKRPKTPEKSKSQDEENSTEQTGEDQHNEATGKDTGLAKGSDDKGAKRNVEEVKVATSLSFTANKDEEHLKTTSDVLDIQTEDVEERNTERTLEKAEQPKRILLKHLLKWMKRRNLKRIIRIVKSNCRIRPIKRRRQTTINMNPLHYSDPCVNANG